MCIDFENDGNLKVSATMRLRILFLKLVMLSGPTATVILSRYTVELHSVALRFPGFGGVSQENRATPPEKGL